MNTDKDETDHRLCVPFKIEQLEHINDCKDQKVWVNGEECSSENDLNNIAHYVVKNKDAAETSSSCLVNKNDARSVPLPEQIKQHGASRNNIMVEGETNETCYHPHHSNINAIREYANNENKNIQPAKQDPYSLSLFRTEPAMERIKDISSFVGKSDEHSVDAKPEVKDDAQHCEADSKG